MFDYLECELNLFQTGEWGGPRIALGGTMPHLLSHPTNWELWGLLNSELNTKSLPETQGASSQEPRDTRPLCDLDWGLWRL